MIGTNAMQRQALADRLSHKGDKKELYYEMLCGKIQEFRRDK